MAFCGLSSSGVEQAGGTQLLLLPILFVGLFSESVFPLNSVLLMPSMFMLG